MQKDVISSCLQFLFSHSFISSPLILDLLYGVTSKYSLIKPLRRNCIHVLKHIQLQCYYTIIKQKEETFASSFQWYVEYGYSFRTPSRPVTLMFLSVLAEIVPARSTSPISTPVTSFTTSKVCFITAGTFCEIPPTSEPVLP